MNVKILESIDAVDAADWNRVAGTDDPFTRHEFLAALEHHDCVGEKFGWLPRHLTLWEGACLTGAAPLYLKDNSYGELVFDWAWADAYQRNGLRYYPKLVSAIPYTPATGHRLLAAEGPGAPAIRQALATAGRELAENLGVSSLHWLFPREEDTAALEKDGLFRRTGCQFHWHNRDYAGFDDFLGALTARKRKNIRRERRLVADAGVILEVRTGGEISDSEWSTWQRLYESTFETKWGIATLTEGFFRELGHRLADQVVVIFARRRGEIIAGALCFRSREALYGRHWGALERHDSLHFETCYYQGIDYCIREGLSRFEPGAQGEHKVPRGFLPATTCSAHWIGDPGFRAAIRRFCDQEADAMVDYMAEMAAHSPYRDQT
ncbi:MAG: GNAT family N-acetyltransferase [Pseudomonadota bacterium]